jgi:MinD superfamily P-loop ATPase
MTNRENNLTQFFTDYLNNKSELTATNITMACYSALNGIDDSLNVAEVVFNMRNDFEYISKVVDDLARSININVKRYGKENKSESIEDNYTIPEIQSIYAISQQAIRKACNEGRLPFKEGQGKNKYLIRKVDIDTYMTSAKGKK